MNVRAGILSLAIIDLSLPPAAVQLALVCHNLFRCKPWATHSSAQVPQGRFAVDQRLKIFTFGITSSSRQGLLRFGVAQVDGL